MIHLKLTGEFPFILMRGKVEILISLCVTVLLLLLQPFSIASAEIGIVASSLSYGLITLISIFFFNNVLKKIIYQQTKKWTIFNEILFILGLLLFITTLNYIYTIAINLSRWDFYDYLYWIKITISVGVFPTVLSVLYISYHSTVEKIKQQFSYEQTAESNDTITFMDSLGNNSLTICAKDFVYAEIKSCTLYINFMHNGVMKSHQMRSTICNIEKAICSGDIVRCHRSFIVTIRYVDSAEGNSNGYRLYLKNCSDVIPVSRRYTLLIKELLDKYFISA